MSQDPLNIGTGSRNFFDWMAGVGLYPAGLVDALFNTNDALQIRIIEHVVRKAMEAGSAAEAAVILQPISGDATLEEIEASLVSEGGFFSAAERLDPEDPTFSPDPEPSPDPVFGDFPNNTTDEYITVDVLGTPTRIPNPQYNPEAESGGLPPESEIDNGPPEPEPEPEPEGGRIIASDLANDDAVRDLVKQYELGELNLSISGILAAIFGANLTEALTSDALINEALALFGLSRDVWDEDPNKQPNDDLPPSDEIENNPPDGEPPEGEPPLDGEPPPDNAPPPEGEPPLDGEPPNDEVPPDGSPPPEGEPPLDGEPPNDELPPEDEIENNPPNGEPPPDGTPPPDDLPPDDDEPPPDDQPPPDDDPPPDKIENNPPDNLPPPDNDPPPPDDDDNGDNGMPDWLKDLLGGLLGDRQPGSSTSVSQSEGGDARAEGGAGGEASNILGDILSTITNTFVEEAPDLVQVYLAQKYASDALERASEDELEFLRELMGRQDTFQLFRNLGLPIKDEDGNIVEDNRRADFQINQLRDLVNRELGDRYKIQPEIDVKPLIQEVTTIDPSDLGQINVADLLMGLDSGAAPIAIDTPVNQIDPFNPEDPALRFLQDEGMRAIESTAAAQGRLNSGGTLDELQDRAINIASQYAGDMTDIGRVQDTSQLAADQQFYSQLLGSGKENLARDLDRYGMVADAQTAADDMFLEGELARFNSEQKNLAQQYDMSRYANVDALARETQLYNEMTPLIDIGLAGAEGLTGNTSTFATSGLPIYKQQGNLSAAEQLSKRQRNTDLARGGYNALKNILGF